jgi:hypothetical protein
VLPDRDGYVVGTVEARDRCVILLGQLEAELVDVLGHASGRRRFRDEAAFDVPTQHDLRRRAPVTLRDRLERRIREALALAEWASGPGDDAIPLVCLLQ